MLKEMGNEELAKVYAKWDEKYNIATVKSLFVFCALAFTYFLLNPFYNTETKSKTNK